MLDDKDVEKLKKKHHKEGLKAKKILEKAIKKGVIPENSMILYRALARAGLDVDKE